MNTTELVEAGLTEGEAKVYLALLELGATSTGPLIETSGVARSFIYHILTSLATKGLVASATKNRTRYYEAAEPSRIIDYLNQRLDALEEKKRTVTALLPSLEAMRLSRPPLGVSVYEGYRGIQTAFEHHETLPRDDEYLVLCHPQESTEYTLYWQRHHLKRITKGIKARMLFDCTTDPAVLKNRNSYKLCDTRYLSSSINSQCWFFVYGDTLSIFLQEGREMAVEIVNRKIAQTFRQIFEDYWARSVPFNTKNPQKSGYVERK